MKTSIMNFKRLDRTAFASLALCLLSAGVATTVAAASNEQAEPSVATAISADEPTGGGFNYLNIAGSAFHPRDSSSTYIYPGAGCVSKTGGGGVFDHRIILPQGARVRYLRIYAYDTSTSSVQVELYNYDAAGDFNLLTSISSVNAAGGYGTELSPLLNYEVDHFTAPINVAVLMGSQNDNTLRFCGVRIAYRDPITDRIFASGFD